MPENTQLPNLNEAKQRLFALLAEDRYEAVKHGFQTYEELVSAVKEANSKDSVSTKAIVEHVHDLPEYETAVLHANLALNIIKESIFKSIQGQPLVAVALYEMLGDYNSDVVKAYRDHVLKFYRSDVSSDEEVSDEDVTFDFTSEDLAEFKKNVLSVFNLAGEPDPEDEDDFSVKKLKAGKTLGLSKVPSSFDNSSQEETEEKPAANGVTTKRQVWYVDGERVQYRNLSEVSLWLLSDGLTMYTSTEVERIIEKQLGHKPKTSEEFDDVEVNGHTLGRKYETVS